MGLCFFQFVNQARLLSTFSQLLLGAKGVCNFITLEGVIVSKGEVEDELCKQRNKPPIQMNILFAEIKDMLNVEHGRFSRGDLIALFAEQKRPLKEQDVDTLLRGICDRGVVELQSRESLHL